jgi:hypothetical protein
MALYFQFLRSERTLYIFARMDCQFNSLFKISNRIKRSAKHLILMFKFVFVLTGIVRTILWNVFCYYKQFESRVSSLIQKAKAPIEKELKVMCNL